ncbi:unnamed protein product [Adineta steineri]|uniref:Uncharacterized protein n=1 Tax=Adineta steineri TaxID=433720 RepID=A0A816CZH6_9BILA|nr:unnamed protein product [Adineta steineri]CAF1629744.1 unnamed protein product [Adineta steineri]
MRLPQSANIDTGETQPIQPTRSRGCIRSKLTWVIFTIVIIAGITIPTAIILTKKENVVETNLTTIKRTTGKGSTTLMLTTTTKIPSTKITESSTTTKIPSTTTTAEQGSTTTEAGLISLDSTGGVVYGIYQTSIGQNSQELKPGCIVGTYPEGESPAKACDGDTSTKYLTFGECNEGETNIKCGLNTGFYLELERGASLVTGLQICTGGDSPSRDPLTVSLEGSLKTITTLLQYIDSDQFPVEYGENCQSYLHASHCILVYDWSKENINEKSIVKN